MAQLRNTMIDGNLEVTGSTTVAGLVDIENGGTNANNKETALINLFGYNPSRIQIYRTYGSNTEISTSINYFKASYGGSNYWTCGTQRGHFSMSSQSFTYGSGTSTATGIKIANDAPSGYILVNGVMRYIKNTSASASIQTGIGRLRNGSVTELNWTCGTYGNERITHTFNQLIYVEAGDFIFLTGYKNVSSADIDIVDGDNNCRWGAVYIATA